jgi:glutamate formiminotransferase
VIVECVINVSEGRNVAVLTSLDAAAGTSLLDRHTDPDHHRSVLTLVGPAQDVVASARQVAEVAVARLDLNEHFGAHPRLGVLDVVPFVPYLPDQLPPTDLGQVYGLRDELARWLADELGVPSFLYGSLPDGRLRTLPQVRRHAFAGLHPDFGPDHPHRTAGATAVGARPVLVAYNVWVSSVGVAKAVAPQVRGPEVRSLGLAVGSRAQVSSNLIDPASVGPAQLYDDVARLVEAAGGSVLGAELVGLVPRAILQAIPEDRWNELGLSEADTVEARLSQRSG